MYFALQNLQSAKLPEKNKNVLQANSNIKSLGEKTSDCTTYLQSSNIWCNESI